MIKLNRITGKAETHVTVKREEDVELRDGNPSFVKIYCQNRSGHCLVRLSYEGSLVVCQSFHELFPDEKNCEQRCENPKKLTITSRTKGQVFKEENIYLSLLSKSQNSTVKV